MSARCGAAPKIRRVQGCVRTDHPVGSGLGARGSRVQLSRGNDRAGVDGRRHAAARPTHPIDWSGTASHRTLAPQLPPLLIGKITLCFVTDKVWFCLNLDSEMGHLAARGREEAITHTGVKGSSFAQNIDFSAGVAALRGCVRVSGLCVRVIYFG